MHSEHSPELAVVSVLANTSAVVASLEAFGNLHAKVSRLFLTGKWYNCSTF